MMWRKSLSVGLLAAVVLALLAAPAVAQMSTREKAFVEGLQKRGLLRLLQQYLEDMEKAGGDALAIKEQQAGLFEMQGLRAPSDKEQRELFAKAKEKYSELIRDLRARGAEETNDRTKDDLRLRALDLMVRKAELIWKLEPGQQLNILELTDREQGDRAMVAQRMREATEVFKAVQRESTDWTTEMAKDTEYERRFLNTGLYDKATLFAEFAKYRIGWTSYYLAYVLPDDKFNIILTDPGSRETALSEAIAAATGVPDVKAKELAKTTGASLAEGLTQEKADEIKAKITKVGATVEIKKERDVLLNDAIAKFGEFAKIEGEAEEKWQSLRLMGMCYREQGLFDAAVENLHKALAGSKSENFKIQIYYELVQVALRARKFIDARAIMDELRSKNYPAMNESFIGRHLMPFLDAKIALAEGQTDPKQKAYGLKLMKELWDRRESVGLVAAEVRKYIDEKNLSKLQPFELWILTDETYLAKDYEKAAQYFEQYLKITDVSDPTHQEAMYNLAVCYYKLAQAEDISDDKCVELMKKGAEKFHEVADRFPKFHSADRAAESYVLLRSEVFRKDPTDENLEAFARSLKWMLDTRPAAADAADIRWLYATVLEKQQRYLEAALQYEKVTKDSPHAYDAKSQAVACRCLDLQESKWMTASAEELPKLAGEVVNKMEQYAEWARATAATAAASDPEMARNLAKNAAKMLVDAAEILSQERVQKYERALGLIKQYETGFPNDKEFKGKALKVKIACYQGQGDLNAAKKVLDELIAAGQDVTQDLATLFGAITEEVERLIRQSRHEEVRERTLPQADQIGKMFRDYLLDKKKMKDVPFVDYQLADLHRRAEDLEGETGAIKRFLNLIGFDPYTNREEFLGTAEKPPREVDLTYLAGLARSVQAAPYVDNRKLLRQEPQKAYDYLKRAAFYWDAVAQAYERPMEGMDPDEQQKTWWDAKYNLFSIYVDLHPLEQKYAPAGQAVDYYAAVRDFITSYKATKSDFGGPEMKVKFGELERRVGN